MEIGLLAQDGDPGLQVGVVVVGGGLGHAAKRNTNDDQWSRAVGVPWGPDLIIVGPTRPFGRCSRIVCRDEGLIGAARRRARLEIPIPTQARARW